MPELRPARENARLEIGSQRGRNSHHIGILGIYDLQGLSNPPEGQVQRMFSGHAVYSLRRFAAGCNLSFANPASKTTVHI